MKAKQIFLFLTITTGFLMMSFVFPQDQKKPGSWEIPLIAQTVAKTKKYDAIVAFGVIIKGDTYHFDMIANECTRALMQLSLDYSIPVAIEVLAVNNLKQAQERASQNEQNKGIEGALAALKTLQTLHNIKSE